MTAMTDLPEMTPSAECRARMALNQCEGVLLSKPAAALLIAREAEAAFYEGALAERERIVALLREPSEELIGKGAYLLSEWLDDDAPVNERRYRNPAASLFRALADRIAAEGNDHAD